MTYRRLLMSSVFSKVRRKIEYIHNKKATYDYALKHHLQPIATCSYAVVWLQRHPEYHGHPGKDYGGCSSCAL